MTASDRLQTGKTIVIVNDFIDGATTDTSIELSRRRLGVDSRSKSSSTEGQGAANRDTQRQESLVGSFQKTLVGKNAVRETPIEDAASMPGRFN